MKKTALTSAIVLVLTGCGSVAQVRETIERQTPDAEHAITVPVLIREQARVTEMHGTMLTASEKTLGHEGGAWLTSMRVSIDASRPIALTQAIAQLAAKGINVTTDLPLDGITFAGTINQTDAESAIRQLLGSTGLDYKVDDANHLITITPLPSRTWYMNLGKRVSSYASSGAIDPTSSTSTSSQTAVPNTTPAAASTTSLGQQTGATPLAGSSSTGSSPTSQSSASGTGTTGVSSTDDFWSALSTELTNRLSMMVPVPSANIGASPMMPHAITQMQPSPMPLPMPVGMPSPVLPTPGMQQAVVQNQGFSYTKKQIGSFSLNPETGAITVQAPHWVLTDLDQYIKRVKQMYNTDLTFTGELVLVSRTDNQSEGFDIQNFAKFASGRYGAILSNSALGGVTVNFPGTGNIPSVTPAAQAVGGALLGIQSSKDGIAAFNDYLGQLGKFAVKQRPVVTTTSGVPGQFSTLNPMYYNTVSQSTAAGNTGAATQATTNTLSEKMFGTTLKVYPRFDMATGLVRAQISVANVIFAGNQSVNQLVSAGTSVQSVTQTIPLEKFFNVSGEALLRDGDLIIVGGQTETTLQTTENGLPLGAVPVGGIFGTKNSTNEGGTYYFALQVSVKKR